MSMNLAELKEAMALDLHGMTREEAWSKGICLECKEPAIPKCYSPEGRGEYRISGLCELCFDALFVETEDVEDDDAETI